MIRLILLLVLFVLLRDLGSAQDTEGFSYKDKGRRNPFVPLVDKTGHYLSSIVGSQQLSVDVVKISGVLWDPQGRSSVLINDQVVGIGQAIYGFKVLEINQDSVKLLKDDKEYIIKLSIEKEAGK